MFTLAKGAALAAIATLAWTATAGAQAFPVTDPEYKCMVSVSKAQGKFVGAKAKCGIKCIQNAVKGANPFADCYAPYGGATAECVDDTVLDKKGAEDKFRDAIKKACDPATKPGTDCPECYSGGDCSSSGEATNRVQTIEGQVDSFGPGVFCEQPGADAAETKCELNTAKVLSKHVGSVHKCYDKCFANLRKGLIPTGSCYPPGPPDATTAACVSTASGKAIAGVDKLCGDVGALPDCSSTDDYPNGTNWVNLVNLAVEGNMPALYCGSPNGAFVE